MATTINTRQLELDSSTSRIVQIATTLSITGTASEFVKEETGSQIIQPSAGITLTANSTITTLGSYTWSYKNNTQSIYTVISGQTTNTLAISTSNFTTYVGSGTSVIFKVEVQQAGIIGPSVNFYTVNYSLETADVITIALSQPNVLVFTDSAGTPSTLAGTGTTVQVVKNGVYLPYHPTNNNSFSIGTTTVSGITMGSGSGTGNVYTFGDIGSFTADTGSATITVNIKNAYGTARTPRTIVQNFLKAKTGAAGATGTKYITVNAFRWLNSGTPTAPTQAATFTWSTSAIDVYPSGWTSSAGAAPATGYTLYQLTVKLSAPGPDTTTAFNWNTGTVGTIGYRQDGTIGLLGDGARIAYLVNTSSTAPVISPNVVTGDTVPSGWTTSATSTLTAGQYQWQSDGIYSTVNNQTTWGNAYLSNLKVGTLSALATDTGNLTIGTNGSIKNFGGGYGSSGFFLGYDSTAYKFSVGDGTAGNTLTWNGTTLAVPAAKITGTLTASQIDSTGLSIKDNSGNVILSAGTPLTSNYITPASGWVNTNITIDSTNNISGIGGSFTRLGRNLLDSGNWVWNTSGSQTSRAIPFYQNASTGTTNTISLTGTPDGTTGLVWVATSGSVNDAEGGWNTGNFPVDHTKPYRFTCWIRRVGSNVSGSFYLGVGGNTVNDIGGSSNSNPYFVNAGRSNLPTGVWCLAVGYVWPNGYSGGQTNAGGLYNGTNGQKILSSTDFRWAAGQTSSYHRCYQYYTTSAGVRQDFFDPRVELIDGTEPSVSQLLATGALNSAISINTNGSLNNAGTGSVTLSGIGYTGDPNATNGAPSGTLVGGTLAQTVESNASNGNSAYSSVTNATTGLNARLRNNAQNVLSGSAGLATGSLTWDSNGNRTGGFGLGITQNGIVGYNSSGNVTFSVNGSTGAAIFKGDISGASGTFTGNITGASGTFSGTISAGTSPAVSGTTMTGSGGVINSTGTFALGNSTKNISFNGSTLTLNGDLVATGNITANAVSNIVYSYNARAGTFFKITATGVNYDSLDAVSIIRKSGFGCGITWTGQVDSEGSNGVSYFRVFKDGVGQISELFHIGVGQRNSMTITHYDNDTSGGVATYRIEARYASGYYNRLYQSNLIVEQFAR